MNAQIDIQDICCINTAVDRYDKQQQRLSFIIVIFIRGKQKEIENIHQFKIKRQKSILLIISNYVFFLFRSLCTHKSSKNEKYVGHVHTTLNQKNNISLLTALSLCKHQEFLLLIQNKQKFRGFFLFHFLKKIVPAINAY